MNLKEYLDKQTEFLEKEAKQAVADSNEKSKYLVDAKIDELKRINDAVQKGVISTL